LGNCALKSEQSCKPDAKKGRLVVILGGIYVAESGPNSPIIQTITFTSTREEGGSLTNQKKSHKIEYCTCRMTIVQLQRLGLMEGRHPGGSWDSKINDAITPLLAAWKRCNPSSKEAVKVFSGVRHKGEGATANYQATAIKHRGKSRLIWGGKLFKWPSREKQKHLRDRDKGCEEGRN